MQRIRTYILLGLLCIAVAAASQTGNFSVSLNIGNVAPTIDWVNNSFSITPVENQTTAFQFQFNATDGNGASDLNDSTAVMYINRSGQSATSTACTATTNSNTKTYNCSINIPYYYLGGTWSIQANVTDNSLSAVSNSTQTFTLNTLKAIQLLRSSLSFSGTPGTNNVLASEGAQIVYNTGNFNYTVFNLTAYDLNGTAGQIPSTDFVANVTASSGVGTQLANATMKAIPSSDFTPGAAANQSLYIYLNIPLGASGSYTSLQNWVVNVN